MRQRLDRTKAPMAHPEVASYLPKRYRLGVDERPAMVQLVKLSTECSEVFFEVRGVAGLSELVDTRFKEMAICPTPDGD